MKIKSTFPILALVFAFVLTSCSSTAQPKPTPIPSESVMPMKTVSMFYVGDTPTGLKLFSEKYSFRVGLDLATEALSLLISGIAAPSDSDYANLWGAGTALNVYTKDGTIGIIDLKMGKLNVGAEAEARAIDQLLWTLASIDPTITGIRLLVDGQPIESLAGHVDATKEIMKQETYEVLNALQIASITEGDALISPVTVFGEACTFEANVVWTLRKDNKVLKREPATAKTACPDRSAWSVDLGNLEPGNYSFTVEDFSAEDGKLTASDNKSFTVTTK